MAEKKTIKKSTAKKTVKKTTKKVAPKLKTIRVQTAERVRRTLKALKEKK